MEGRYLEDEFSPEQKRQLQILATTFSCLSLLCGLFLVSTFTIFPQKRKNTTAHLLFFLTINGLVMNILTLISGVAAQLLQENEPFCIFQGFGLNMAGNGLLWSWFLLAVNLHRQVCLNLHELNSTMSLLFCIVLSFILSLVPVVARVVEFDTLWCFTANDEILYLFICLYGGMTIATFIGSGLWFLAIYALFGPLQRERQKMMSSVNNGAPNESQSLLPGTSSQQLPSGNSLENGKLNYVVKRNAFLRQLGFVGWFLLVNIFMLGTRLYVTSGGFTFGTWVMLNVGISLSGTFLFLFLGLTERNLQLWGNFFKSKPTLIIGARRSTGGEELQK